MDGDDQIELSLAICEKNRMRKEEIRPKRSFLCLLDVEQCI